MAIVGAFDVHRRQITFDYWDSETDQVRRGRFVACRQVLRHWLDRFADREEVRFAVEGCTGWLSHTRPRTPEADPSRKVAPGGSRLVLERRLG